MKKLFAILAVLAMAQPAWAAIAVDNTNAASLTNDGNITLTTKSATLLIAACGIDENSFPITGITFDGVALTVLNRNPHSASNTSAEIWYLANPNSGTDLVTAFNFSGANEYNCRVTSFTGTATSTIFSGTTNAERNPASSAEITVTFPCPTDSLGFSIVSATSTTNWTATQGATRLGTETENISGSSAVATEAGATGADITMGEDPDSSELMVMTGTCIAPAAAASTTRRPAIIIQ